MPAPAPASSSPIIALTISTRCTWIDVLGGLEFDLPENNTFRDALIAALKSGQPFMITSIPTTV